MNNGSNKKCKTLYYIRSKNVYANNEYENKSERKKGHVFIKVSEANGRNFPYRKRKSEKKKNYELIFQSCQQSKLPVCTIRNFKKKKIRNTWEQILLEKVHDATNKINEKVLSLLKICIIKIYNFSSKLKIKNEKIVRDSLKYLNIENEEIQSNYSNIQNPINISRTPKKKLRDNCCRCILRDNSVFNSENLKRGYYEMNNTNIYKENNFMKCKDLHELFNEKTDHTNNILNNCAHLNEKTNKFVSEDEHIGSNLRNIRNFYISVINKNTNTKKKNQGEMSQIHNNFFSTLINVDDVNFLEENVSTSILRHIIKRLNSLFQIPTNNINSIEFCLYIRSNDKEEAVYFTEQNTYKYSILIFLNARNDNYIEFPKNGLRIMTTMGNCLIYECNKNSFGSNIFKFDISEEKIFFLKLNLKYDINLHRLFINEANTKKYVEEFSKESILTELNRNMLKNQNVLSNNDFINNTFNTYNAVNFYSMNNHHSYIKKHIESINEKLMEININRIKSVTSLKNTNADAYYTNL